MTRSMLNKKTLRLWFIKWKIKPICLLFRLQSRFDAHRFAACAGQCLAFSYITHLRIARKQVDFLAAIYWPLAA